MSSRRGRAIRDCPFDLYEIAPELKGKPVAPVERMREFDRRFQLVGWHGLIGMAVSGLDMAFWDAIARTLDQPVVSLLMVARLIDICW